MDPQVVFSLFFVIFLAVLVIMAMYPKHHHKIHPFRIGDVKYSTRTRDEDGWLICDGRSLNRQAYDDLFEIVGTSFGSVSSTTFNLPDMRGRIPGSVGSGSGLTNRHIGDLSGNEYMTLTLNELPAHNHDVTDLGHSHGFRTYNDDFSNPNSGTPGGFVKDADPTIPSSIKVWNIDNQGVGVISAPTGISINNKGSGNSFNLLQPTLFIGNMFIYAGHKEYVSPPTPTPTPHP